MTHPLDELPQANGIITLYYMSYYMMRTINLVQEWLLRMFCRRFPGSPSVASLEARGSRSVTLEGAEPSLSSSPRWHPKNTSPKRVGAWGGKREGLERT